MMAADDNNAIMHAFLGDAQITRAARYTELGKAFAGLAEEELSERWLAAFRAWARDWAAEAGGAERDDFESELLLRGLRPPYEAVGSELAALKAQAAVALRRLDLTPELRDRLSERFVERLAAFIASMDGPRS